MDNSRKRGLRSFARDVAVNVAGNLVAVAIIYLAAVVGGYIVGNRILIGIIVALLGTAVSITMFGGGVELTYYGERHSSRMLEWSGMAMSLLGVVTFLEGLVLGTMLVE